MNNEMNVFNSEAGKNDGIMATSHMMMSRQAQEVQAAMVVAKRFPRNQSESADRILKACTRSSLAESALYEYPRGGNTITGPSIRLAEAIAQNWGNIDFGIIELEQKSGESQVMSYAWDLETNTRQTKVFNVPHIRVSAKGATPLTDPRDIYEMVANQGARRLRSCILGVIPGDVIDMAIKACEVTLKNNKDPLEVRIANMVEAFENDFKIGPDALEKFIGKSIEAFDENNVIRLAKVYRSLKDGVIGCEYFADKLSEKPAGNSEKKTGSNKNPTTPKKDEADEVNIHDLP